MTFVLNFTDEAISQLKVLKSDRGLLKHFKAASECLKKLEQNPRHPGLQTHEYSSLRGPSGEKVFEAYAQNHTPGAYRVFWCYGPGKGEITILSIVHHP